MLKHLSITSALALALLAAPAQARVALQDDRQIEDGLTVVAIGKVLTRQCDGLAPRYWKAYRFARSLQARARKLGYNDTEIDAYLESDSDKDRIKSVARSYLENRGVNYSDPKSFCAVGQSEIAKQTSVGKFLRER